MAKKDCPYLQSGNFKNQIIDYTRQKDVILFYKGNSTFVDSKSRIQTLKKENYMKLNNYIFT